MAEIRSTMDMVMERAARMAAESKADTSSDDIGKEGMRLAAEYLQSGDGNLRTLLEQRRPKEQMPILQGMTDILLRNILLPRDESLLKNSIKALDAVAELAPGDVASICKELQQILSQYSQHKEQMQQQLDDAIRAQLEQKLAQQGKQLSEGMTINPAMHPQYREELERMLSNLNGQYNEALDQRKELIRQRLIPGI